jgi:hypothetical protein
MVDQERLEILKKTLETKMKDAKIFRELMESAEVEVDLLKQAIDEIELETKTNN